MITIKSNTKIFTSGIYLTIESDGYITNNYKYSCYSDFIYIKNLKHTFDLKDQKFEVHINDFRTKNKIK